MTTKTWTDNCLFSRRFHRFGQQIFNKFLGSSDLRIYLAKKIMVTQYQPKAMKFVLTWYNLISLISHCLICFSWWYGRNRSRGGSASGRLGLPGWWLSRTVRFYDRQSVSVTGLLCLWLTVCDRQSGKETVYVCHRQSVTDTVYVCHRLSVSVIYSLFLLQTVCVCHRQTMSVTDSLCLSQTVCVCHRQSVSVTDSLCLSQTVYVCHRQSLSVTGSLCLTQTLFAYLYLIFTKICSWDLNLFGV